MGKSQNMMSWRGSNRAELHTNIKTWSRRTSSQNHLQVSKKLLTKSEHMSELRKTYFAELRQRLIHVVMITRPNNSLESQTKTRSENNRNICLLMKNANCLQKNRVSMGCLPLEMLNICHRDCTSNNYSIVSHLKSTNTQLSCTAAEIPASAFVPLLNLI